jgi:GNAT superfamily N-acetyltransferase
MIRIENITQKVSTLIRTLFEALKYNTVEMILFENHVINDIFTKAHICMVTYRNVTDICEYEGEKNLKKYKRFLQRGDLGYYAYLDGKWIHRSWVVLGPRVTNRWFRFPPFVLKSGEAYCHFGETAPISRGRNISSAVLSRIAEDLKGKAEHIYTLVDENNYASRRANEKAGFVEIKRIKKTSFFGLNFYRKLK